ncbi:MAG: EAL domain-containing protein, partial [Xenococcaceae cyanobacterium MO_188.B32]|nr:EAL domain-containing protein [Xenococcaceae cyanobacterium MO_188.B32]
MLETEKSNHLLIVEEPGFRKTITLENPSYTAGRHSENDIIFSSQKTSRYHATFVRRTEMKTNKFSYWIIDGNLQGNRSRNGIFVNGKKCLVHELKHGDIIKFSNDVKARYHILSNLSEVIENSTEISELEHKKFSQRDNRSKTLINKETVIAPYEQFDQLNDSELVRLSSIGELSSQPIIEIDLNGNITYINSVALIRFKDLTRKRLNHPLLKGLMEVCNQQTTSCVREIAIESHVFKQNAYYLPENKIIRSYLTDITQKRKLEQLTKNKGNIYQTFLQQITDSVILIDSNSKKIVFINDACSKLLGYSVTTANSIIIDDLISDSVKFRKILDKVVANNNKYQGTFFLFHQDGFKIELNLDINFVDLAIEQVFYIIIRHNKNDLIQDDENSFWDFSEKKVYKKQLETALANAKRNKKIVGVMCLNIENFEEIEHQINKDFSFLLLSSIYDRLKTCLRLGDTVSYWQGNKFALLMPEIGGVEEVAKISKRIIDSLETPFKIEEQILQFDSNIGIAIYPQDGENSTILIKNADLALARIQDQENSNYLFYDSNINAQTSEILKLEKFLYRALDKKELLLHYQPQVNTKNGCIQGIEALLRWQHPELGLLLPNSFIKVAEKSSLILPIGEWVLRTACQQNKIWQAEGLPPIRMSVNISHVEFKQPNFPELIKTILHETRLSPNFLELEITANTLMEDDEYSYQVLCELTNMGVTISIDDFTAGLSSLDKLKKFPLNAIKIDQNFVKELKNESQDLAIIATMVALGRGLNLRVVAEGVETQEQMKLLKSQQCEEMQGFWFSRPLAAEEAIKLLPFDY